ncbi:hypothetical protein SLS56_008580 [Neofusicoccum ribis]|uniref:PNPLA domain-containing protein n=1 Tax=Neofusicoccum ribis TaxID=45134 RepID=A0ABR3SJQ5_9PEZI
MANTQKSHLQPSLIDTPIEESNHTGFGSFPAAEVSIPQECEQCGRDDSHVSFCNVCDAVFCAACWEKQIQHKRRKTGFSGIPHEKTPASIAQKVQNVLKPPVDESKREQLHLHDADTAWFGIFRPEDGSPLFQDYGRFQDLMIMTEQGNGGSSHASFQGVQSPERDFRTPSLVSFVGETGAGKSTLIKLLIELNSEPHQVYTTPVVGASGSDVPTSEDVHLYLEPQTAYSSTPVLFADCEGLTGGTREPMGALFKKKRSQAKSRATGKDDHLAHKERPLSERKITWADNTLKRSREFAVTNLYPRLLYTFSDVVVFVLREARIMESVFERLVEWAVAALEMSSNQPVLPHAIIVLNASSNDIDPALWNSETATETIFRNLRGTLSNNNVFKKQAQIWRERGQEIESLEQLMLSYYSSVQIIRVPEKGRPKLIQTQAQELYSSIRTACTWARDSRAELRMLLDVEELQSYLDCAFDHFARALDKPFDFVQASLANSPIPLDFGGNILKLAINVMEAWQGEFDARTIFQELSYVVASCIMFDLARNKNKGTVESNFPLYLEHLDAALENFCNSHWPCEFVKPGTGARCVNVRSGHAKGHQRKDGKVLAVGEYISSISFRIYHDEFQKNVFLSLKDLQSLLHKQMGEEGGMRGIVELEVLRLIERAMGDKLPIRHFFDLVVGTSTGGIIALGLVSQGWSVEECLTFFERLCATAFTPRIASCLPGISWIINNYHHSLYETSPLERSLVEAFGNDQYLFGGRGAAQSSGVKVAVITTSAATGTPVVLSNYNRPCSEKLSYQFQRSENIKSEVKLWEAGRATSAAPRFFKSFHHEASQQIYLDGAIYHNNPVAIAERERKLIWTDQPSESPDIILSLGTGSSLRHRQDPAASLRRSPISRIPQQGLLANGRNLMKIAKDHVYASLDCDRAWYSFVGDLPQSWESSRFVRISPEKPDLPRLDEVGVMKELQAYVRQKLSSREHEIVIRRLAMRLVATSFFFELRKPIAEDKVASGT